MLFRSRATGAVKWSRVDAVSAPIAPHATAVARGRVFTTGVDTTVRAFNAASRTDVPFNPNIHDGLRTNGLPIDKTNWAQCLDTPPYEAYAVTTGITFTFGGLKITNNGEVEDTTGRAIPGLFAAGEIVGGLFYHNYASGTGLMAGAVFGRIAGKNAAACVKPR